MNQENSIVSLPSPLTLNEEERASVRSWPAPDRAIFEAEAARAEFLEGRSLSDAEAMAFERVIKRQRAGGAA